MEHTNPTKEQKEAIDRFNKRLREYVEPNYAKIFIGELDNFVWGLITLPIFLVWGILVLPIIAIIKTIKGNL